MRKFEASLLSLFGYGAQIRLRTYLPGKSMRNFSKQCNLEARDIWFGQMPIYSSLHFYLNVSFDHQKGTKRRLFFVYSLHIPFRLIWHCCVQFSKHQSCYRVHCFGQSYYFIILSTFAWYLLSSGGMFSDKCLGIPWNWTRHVWRLF